MLLSSYADSEQSLRFTVVRASSFSMEQWESNIENNISGMKKLLFLLEEVLKQSGVVVAHS